MLLLALLLLIERVFKLRNTIRVPTTYTTLEYFGENIPTSAANIRVKKAVVKNILRAFLVICIIIIVPQTSFEALIFN